MCVTGSSSFPSNPAISPKPSDTKTEDALALIIRLIDPMFPGVKYSDLIRALYRCEICDLVMAPSLAGGHRCVPSNPRIELPNRHAPAGFPNAASQISGFDCSTYVQVSYLDAI